MSLDRYAVTSEITLCRARRVAERALLRAKRKMGPACHLAMQTARGLWGYAASALYRFLLKLKWFLDIHTWVIWRGWPASRSRFTAAGSGGPGFEGCTGCIEEGITGDSELIDDGRGSGTGTRRLLGPDWPCA